MDERAGAPVVVTGFALSVEGGMGEVRTHGTLYSFRIQGRMGFFACLQLGRSEILRLVTSAGATCAE